MMEGTIIESAVFMNFNGVKEFTKCWSPEDKRVWTEVGFFPQIGLICCISYGVFVAISQLMQIGIGWNIPTACLLVFGVGECLIFWLFIQTIIFYIALIREERYD